MLHGLPIVVTHVGALPDMVQDGSNGCLVDPGAPARALCTLLADPSHCRRPGRSSFDRASTFYTWPAVGQRIRARILRVLAQLNS
jgi:glycosyltransferase involved in cell wall biosynthesis